MKYRIIDKSEVWAKIIEGRAIYLCSFASRRIINCNTLSVDTIKSQIASDNSLFIEDIAPDYDNQNSQDGE